MGGAEFSNPHNMVGYVFDEIDRRDDVVCPEVVGDNESGKDKQHMPDLKNIGSIKFSWTHDGVEKREAGVALFRNMCGKGNGAHGHEWHFFDTYHSGRLPRTDALNHVESDLVGFPVWGKGMERKSRLVITDPDRAHPPCALNSMLKEAIPSIKSIKEMLGARGLPKSGNKTTLMQRLEEAEMNDNEDDEASDGAVEAKADDGEMAADNEEGRDGGADEESASNSKKHTRRQTPQSRYTTVFDQPPDGECVPSCLQLKSWVYVAFKGAGVCRGLVIKVPRKSGKKGATTGKYDVCFNEKGQAEAYAFTAPFLRFTRAEAEEDLREAEHDEDEERDEEGDQPDASSDKSD